jgi:hypothetical protein
MVKILMVNGIVLLGSLCCVSQQPRQVTVQQVLSNQKIWGKDLSTALADVLAWQKLGGHSIAIKANSVQSTTPIGDVKETVSHVERAVTTAPMYTRDVHRVMGCDEMVKMMCTVGVLGHGQMVTESKDLGTTTVATKTPQLQFIAPAANIELLRKELGPPEKVTQEVVQTEYERQPVVVTKYHYASGAIVFATTNMKPNGKIDRAIIDADAVAKVVSGEHK